MKIGIYGSGNIGAVLAKLWLDAGHEVRFGARDPGKTAAKGGLDPRAKVGPLGEVAAWSEAILLAIPFFATPDVAREIAEGARGKPVLDAGNAVPVRDGPAAQAAKDAGGTGLWVAGFLPGAHVVKAYNTVYFRTIASQAHRPDPKVAVPLAGDDEGALSVAERLVRDSGLEPLRAASLAEGWKIDHGTPVWNTNWTAAEVRASLGLRG